MKNVHLIPTILFLILFNSIFIVVPVHAQEILINLNSSWKYLDNGSNQNTSWRTTTFNDNTWPSGSAELGYGDSPVTVLSSYKIGYYFRKTISITNPLQYSDFTFKVRRDDGIIIYINNSEVYRNNMPSGIVYFNTKASSNCSDNGNAIFTIKLLNSVFKAGTNTIAAEVHNRSSSSSDLTFELQLIANPLIVLTCPTPNSNLFGNKNVTATTAKIIWVPLTGVSSYNFKYRIRNVGANYSEPFSIDSASIEIVNLFPSTNYEFIVQSNCSDGGISSYSESGWFSTLPNPEPQTCSSPEARTFEVRNISSNSATIFWTGVTGAQSYNVAYKEFNSTEEYLILVNSISDFLFLNNLKPATGYEIKIQSVCSLNTVSDFSDITIFGTLDDIPSPTCGTPDTTFFSTGNITSNSATLNWADVTDALSYNVKYKILNSNSDFWPSINTATNTIELNNLLPSTIYEFIIQNVCLEGEMSTFSKSKQFTTLKSVPVATLLRDPYMTIATSSSITIQWRTNINTNTVVKYGKDLLQLNYSVNNAGLSTEHSITLTALLPNTKYYYSIGTTDYILQGNYLNYFYSAPADGSTQPVKFWVTGDFGNGSAEQISVRNSFINYTSGQIVNGWLWLGDNAYSSGTDLQYQTKVFDVYNSIFKNTAVFPTPGNHDYAQSGYQSAASLGVNFPYFSIFNLPAEAGTEKYYSTNYANIHFISLDSYGSYNNSSSEMYNWLSNDLANNTQLWTVVFFHHPPYSKGSHNSDTEIELIDMRKNIIPLLESYGVDLVLSGHSHSYERSSFIKNHAGLENTFNSSIFPSGNIVQAGGGPYTKTSRTGNGTVYVVCGVSGQNGGSTMPGYPHNAMYKSITTSNGSLILDIEGGILICKFLTSSGAILDQFTIQKTNSAPARNTNSHSMKVEIKKETAVFPNPSTGDINIKINNTENIQINVSITDSHGTVLFKKHYLKVFGENILIDKWESKLNAGIYFVNIIGDNLNTINKIVIN